MTTVVLYLHIFVAACLAHPAIAIPIVTGLISLVYGKLDSYPRIHALLSIAVKAGFDLPAILEAVRRLWTGVPPTRGLASSGRSQLGGADATTPIDVPSIPPKT